MLLAAAPEDKHLVRQPLDCLRRPLMCEGMNVSPDWAEAEAEPETGRATAGNGSYFTMGADKSHTHSAARQRQRGNKLVKGSLLIEIAA